VRLAAIVSVLLLVATSSGRAKSPRPSICSSGRFVVQGGPLLDEVADARFLTVGDGTASIGTACTNGTARIARPKRTSTLAARWKPCANIAVVRVKARFDAACDTLTGVVRAKKHKRRSFTATRTRCGDGVVDAGNGEACDGDAGCGAQLHCSAACACAGDSGSRDASFGSSGVATVGYGNTPFLLLGMGVQPTGGIIVAGSIGAFGTPDAGVGVARFTSDGVLDPSFGTGGWTITTPAPTIDTVSDMRVLPDGRIVVAGRTGFGDHRVILRFDADGHPDPLFGVGGMVTLTSVSCFEPNPRIAVAPNGAVYASYPDVGCTNPNFKTKVVRLDDAGMVDGGFTLGLAVSAGLPVVRPDGRVALATFFQSPSSVRLFETSGLPDLAFGTSGAVYPSFGTYDPRGVRLFDDTGSRLVGAAAAPTAGGTGFALERWTADGADDDGFGSGGRVVTPGSGNEYAVGLAFDATARLVVVGSGPAGLLVRRYADDGTLDAAFAGGGAATLASAQGVDVVVLPSGEIVVAGRLLPATMSDPYQFGALVRMWP